MTTLYYEDESVTLWHGDALIVLRGLGSESVDCIVTSPPYYGLRDYGVDGQIGAEPAPAAFVAALVEVFHEARRVLAGNGTFWLNLGDSYSTKSKGSDGTGRSTLGAVSGGNAISDAGILRSQQRQQTPIRHLCPDVPEKNLLGIPWRVAFALQDDGWTLRNDIIWAKPNAMPESVTDRLSNRHEHLFMFSKSRRYWFDLDPIREPHLAAVPGKRGPGGGSVAGDSKGLGPTGEGHAYGHEAGRNPGDVWSIPTQPFPGAHFAVYPLALPERCILAGCKPGGIVLDPFSGSGTTGMAAAKHGRRYVGIDLNADYLSMSLRTRLQQPGLNLGEWSA